MYVTLSGALGIIATCTSNIDTDGLKVHGVIHQKAMVYIRRWGNPVSTVYTQPTGEKL